MLIGNTASPYGSNYSAYVVGERQRTEATLQIYIEQPQAARNLPVFRVDPNHVLDIYA